MLLSVVLLIAQLLSIARAQTNGSCQFSRKFSVDNCTACPTLDTTRNNIEMAKCEGHGTNGSLFCVCGDFPAYAAGNMGLDPVLKYYPQVTEDGTVCTNDWAVAPYSKVGFRLVGFGLTLYVTAHAVYIIWQAGLFTCQRNKCTKMNISALCVAIIAGITYGGVNILWRLQLHL